MAGSQHNRSPAFDDEAIDHLGALQNASRRLTRNRPDAEDLVQDAYLQALKAADRFTPGTNLRAWLRTILNNLAKNRRRDASRARVHANEYEVARAAATSGSVHVTPEQQLLSSVVAPRLRDALEGMPKALRDAVWLCDVEELTYAEIAQRMRIPIGTVMSRISRGRRLLHARLVALEGSEVKGRR